MRPKHLFSLLTFLISFTINHDALSQIKALTSEGEEVDLFDDGTWRFTKDSIEVVEIDTNKTSFRKPADASFQVKSSKSNVSVFFNPKQWLIEKGSTSEAAEYKFKAAGKDIEGKMITERIEIPVTMYPRIAIMNARKAAPNAKVVKREYRNVNGKTVLFMQITGSTMGMKFVYLGYYYSSDKGSVQLVTYTTQNLFEQYKGTMQALLNGFTVLN